MPYYFEGICLLCNMLAHPLGQTKHTSIGQIFEAILYRKKMFPQVWLCNYITEMKSVSRKEQLLVAEEKEERER